MRYELNPFTPVLIEARNVFRKANKLTQSEIMQVMLDCVPESTRHVLDGGALLHRVPWQIGTRYGEIATSYADFAIRHYGPATIVVFDGYEEGPSIKDNTHQRRGRNMHPVASFTAETEFSGKKEVFLPRDNNKQRLIRMISDQLRERDCNVVNAHRDAGVDIVKTQWIHLFNTLLRSLEKTRIYVSYSSTMPSERL